MTPGVILQTRPVGPLPVPSPVQIACSDLVFEYVRGRTVLGGVHCEIGSGRVTALVGPNGAGKSTLLRMMAGLIAPTSGRVTLEPGAKVGVGSDTPSRQSLRDVADIDPTDRARHIAYVAQRSSVAFAFPARQVVAMGRHAVGRDDDAVDRAIGALDLSMVADRPFNTLSAGQQQRVSIARAVAQLSGGDRGRRFLLADEPLAALDPRHVIQSLELFRSLAGEGVGVVLVLHDLTSARRIADEAILLNCGGTLGATGSASEVLTPTVLGPAYGVRFESLSLPGGVRALVPVGAEP